MDHRIKGKRNYRQIRGPCQRTKTPVVQERDGDANFSRCDWNGHKRLRKANGRIENQSKNRDHPDYSIMKIGDNT